MMGPPLTAHPEKLRAALAKVPLFTEKGMMESMKASAARKGLTLLEYMRWLMSTDIDTGSIGPPADEDI